MPSEVSSVFIKSLNVFVAFKGCLFKYEIVTLAAEVLPTITSSAAKFKSFVGSIKSLFVEVNAAVAFTVAVAPDVCPVTVSPTVNVLP